MFVERQTEITNTITKPSKGSMAAQDFRPGQAVSMPARSGAGTLMHNFFCVDERTSTIIGALSKGHSFSNWKKEKDSVWLQTTPFDLTLVQTRLGWIVLRGGYSDYERVLSHHHYALPLLFTTPEMAQAAAELSCPNLHPALSWMVQQTWDDKEKAIVEIPWPIPAIGWLEWARALPDLGWMSLWTGARAASVRVATAGRADGVRS